MSQPITIPAWPCIYIYPADRWLPDGWPVPRVGDEIGAGNWVKHVIWGTEKITVITEQQMPTRGCCG